jgi:hypothetical protein
MSTGDIEAELLRRERAAGRQPDAAQCTERQASGGRQYICEVLYDTGSSINFGATGFLATVDAGDNVRFQRR